MINTIKAIAQQICGIDTPCEKCGDKAHCEITFMRAQYIYTAHVKPLEDALAKCEAESQKRLAHCRFEFDKAENAIAELTAANERERVLVEALMECVDVMETTDDANMQKAIIEALKQARAALASVKEAPCPKN